MNARDLEAFAKSNGASTRITRVGTSFEVRAFVPTMKRDEFKAAAIAAGVRLTWNGSTNARTLSVTLAARS